MIWNLTPIVSNGFNPPTSWSWAMGIKAADAVCSHQTGAVESHAMVNPCQSNNLKLHFGCRKHVEAELLSFWKKPTLCFTGELVRLTGWHFLAPTEKGAEQLRTTWVVSDAEDHIVPLFLALETVKLQNRKKKKRHVKPSDSPGKCFESESIMSTTPTRKGPTLFGFAS